MVLPDLLQSDLKVVFCGTAAGDKSAAREAYYAGIGNSFYPTLALCGFTPYLDENPLPLKESQILIETPRLQGLTIIDKIDLSQFDKYRKKPKESKK